MNSSEGDRNEPDSRSQPLVVFGSRRAGGMDDHGPDAIDFARAG